MKFVAYIEYQLNAKQVGLGLAAQQPRSRPSFADRYSYREFFDIRSVKPNDRTELKKAIAVAKREGARLLIAARSVLATCQFIR